MQKGGKRGKVMEYRNRELARDLSNYIKTLANEQHYLIMHVCGTHLPLQSRWKLADS